MRTRELLTIAAGLWAAVATASAPASEPAAEKPLPFEELAARCAPDVHPTTLKGVVSTQSSWNPYAIGVVGGRLERQPRSLDEAVSAARELERQGFNFSMGLGQVNRYNLAKYGETYETIFEPCRNLRAGSAILKDCYVRAKKSMDDEQQALRAAFSCYYSGNFTRGFRPDKAGQPSYVQKVAANAVDVAQAQPVVPAVRAQSSDGAVLVRPAARERATASKATPPTAQWVVFTDAPVIRAEPEQFTPASRPSRQNPTPASPLASVAVRQHTPQDAPFVQILD